MTLYLVDKSAWEQRRHSDVANGFLKELISTGSAATCDIIELEVLYSARNANHYRQLRDWLNALEYLPVTERCWRRALDVQERLANQGEHRRPLPDLIIAATADIHSATVLHYDHDFDIISRITDQPTRWIVERGSVGQGGERE